MCCCVPTYMGFTICVGRVFLSLECCVVSANHQQIFFKYQSNYMFTSPEFRRLKKTILRFKTIKIIIKTKIYLLRNYQTNYPNQYNVLRQRWDRRLFLSAVAVHICWSFYKHKTSVNMQIL